MEKPPPLSMLKLEQIFDKIYQEYIRAHNKFAAIHSPHEGYAVILEELDELWDEIKPNNGRKPAAMKEALQVATMAIRYIMDLEDG